MALFIKIYVILIIERVIKMYGAIIGDLAGSLYEYGQIKKVKEVKEQPKNEKGKKVKEEKVEEPVDSVLEEQPQEEIYNPIY